MDIGIHNNNLSFRASIVTSMNKPNDIMPSIDKVFKRLTKNIEGELRISCIVSGDKESLKFSTDMNHVSIVTRSFNRLLATPSENTDSSKIRNIAIEFATLFRALRRQDKYVDSVERQVKTLKDANSKSERLNALKNSTGFRSHSLRYEACLSHINKAQKDANAAKAKIQTAYNKTIQDMDMYKNSLIYSQLIKSVPKPDKLQSYYNKI